MRLFSRLMAHLERVTVFHRMMGLTWVSLSVILLIGGLLYSKMGADDFIERSAQNPRDTEMAVRAVRREASFVRVITLKAVSESDKSYRDELVKQVDEIEANLSSAFTNLKSTFQGSPAVVDEAEKLLAEGRDYRHQTLMLLKEGKMEKAEQILIALYDGRLADPSTAAKVMAEQANAGVRDHRHQVMPAMVERRAQVLRAHQIGPGHRDFCQQSVSVTRMSEYLDRRSSR